MILSAENRIILNTHTHTLWFELCPLSPPKEIYPGPNFSTCEHDLVCKQGLCRCNQIKRRGLWIRTGPNPIAGVLLRMEFGQRHRGNCEHRRHCSLRTEKQKSTQGTTPRSCSGACAWKNHRGNDSRKTAQDYCGCLKSCANIYPYFVQVICEF